MSGAGSVLAPAVARAVRRAADAIARGAIVAFPTETYYGLAVPALDGAAVARLCALKGRAASRALPVIVDSLAMVDQLAREVPPRARELMARYWPGPLTLVLPARPEVPPPLCGPHGVGVRISSHPVARALVRACHAPLTATSANLSGQPPARRPAEVRASLGSRVHLLAAGETPGGPPSTVAYVAGERIVVVRAGAVVLE